MEDRDHRKALIAWLNRWGCRQFALDYHDLASRQIHSWYNQYGQRLFPRDRGLPELTESELASAAAAYQALSRRIASYRATRGGISAVSIGPTGAAKGLFAIRPRAVPPWDEPIRRQLRFARSADAYLSFLATVRRALRGVERHCRRIGLDVTDLPSILGRPRPTRPKLIDEYHWVTITKSWPLPDHETLRRWATWTQGE